MHILYIDVNYLFNKLLRKTINQQRIKYSHKQMPKNMIILNRYNLMMDTIFSISTNMDAIFSELVKQYDTVYIINTNALVYRKLPNKYNSGYYLPAFKRFGSMEELIASNMYTTKLVKSCLANTTHGVEIEVEEERVRKQKNSRKKLFKLKIAKNVYSIVDEYAGFYEKEYKEKWKLYDERQSAKKVSKLPHYVKDFRMNLFFTQNFLTNQEIELVYKYLVKNCKLKHAKIDKIVVNDDRITILSDRLLTDKSLHSKGSSIKYIKINNSTGKIVNANVNQMIKKQTIGRILSLPTTNKTMLDLVLGCKQNVWKNNIIDIDHDNYINMFTEHTQYDLYNKIHTKSILTEYNYMQNYREVNIVNESFYTKYLPKVLKSYKFTYFRLC